MCVCTTHYRHRPKHAQSIFTSQRIAATTRIVVASDKLLEITVRREITTWGFAAFVKFGFPGVSARVCNKISRCIEVTRTVCIVATMTIRRISNGALVEVCRGHLMRVTL